MKKIIPFIILTTATGCTVDGVTNSDEKLEHKIAKALGSMNKKLSKPNKCAS
jgi:hypothetical protein